MLAELKLFLHSFDKTSVISDRSTGFKSVIMMRLMLIETVKNLVNTIAAEAPAIIMPIVHSDSYSSHSQWLFKSELALSNRVISNKCIFLGVRLSTFL